MGMDAKSFLMGSGNPGFSFIRPGDAVAGEVVGEPTVQQQKKFGTNDPDFWPSGDPKYQMLVPLQTAFRSYEGIANPDRATPDTGMRTLYVKGKHFESALRIAIRAAGATFLDLGGFLEVVYTGDDMTSKAGSKPKMFAVRYRAPIAAAQQAFLGTQGGQGYQSAGFAPQAPPQPAYPAQIPVSHSEPWPPQIQQPIHHSQGPMPDWAQPAPQPVTAAVAPASAPPSTTPGLSTLDMLRGRMAQPLSPTDDVQPAF